MRGFIISHKRKIIILISILVVIFTINISLNYWNNYKYKTGYGLTNIEKSQNIKIAILAKQYDKAFKLCDNYYENNENIRYQWKSKIEKCKDQGLTPSNVAELDNIY